MEENFDDIRPYRDDELPAALRRLAAWSQFDQAARFIYPELTPDEARAKLTAIGSVNEFQATFMNTAIRRIIGATTAGFTCSGLSHLKPGRPYLYISNHRDITLDAFLLQHLLIEHLGETSYIVFGNNLIASDEIGDLFRSNKLVQMSRGGSPREFYRSLKHLSDYLNRLVVKERHSLWIAQRNGRAKDGLDATQPAVIKMLTLGCGTDPLKGLAAMHLVPMSVSYEWDPCDLMKCHELYATRRGEYHKAEGEDMNSVVTGIIGDKGHVHLTIGKPLTAADLRPAEGEELADHVASVLDRRIIAGYRLMPTNYAAYDLLHGGEQYRSRYTAVQKHRFELRMGQLPTAEHRQIFLEMYANPVGRE